MIRKLMQTSICVLLVWISTAHAGGGEFLVIADLHFNPFQGLSPDQFKELSATPAGQWRSFFARLHQPIPSLGSDTNGRLLDSALAAVAERVETPEFTLFAGDFLGHDWVSRYNALAPQSIIENAQAYREFTVKTLRFIAAEFQTRFPGTTVLPTLGNEDAFCQDYWIQPQGGFLAQFAEVWRPLLGATVDSATFERSFLPWGCYAADLPGMPNHRLIVFDSVFLSKSYCADYHDPATSNCCECAKPGDGPGAATLAWLEVALQKSSEENKRVWLLMHVPPGLDSYREDKADGKSLTASLWTQDFLGRYLELVGKHRSILQIAFTGHTHMDDFRIVRIDGNPVLLHKIVPAVSPVFGNNPAFQVYQVDPNTGSITDWQTYFLDLSRSDSFVPTPTWNEEYDGSQAYGLSALDARTASALFERIRSNPVARESGSYRDFFKVGVKAIPRSHLPIYACAVLNAACKEYGHCVSAHNLPAPVEIADSVKLRRKAGGLGEPQR